MLYLAPLRYKWAITIMVEWKTFDSQNLLKYM